MWTADRLRVRMAHVLMKMDSRHVIQSSSEVVESRFSNPSPPTSLPRRCANARPNLPWHTHPLASSLATFDTPTAGSSSLSIVSSRKFGSIGKGRKITTMQGTGAGEVGERMVVGAVAEGCRPAVGDVCRCDLTICSSRTGACGGQIAMAKYLVPCVCGRQHAVDTGQAGESLVCECGATVAVPTLRQLRELPPAREESPAGVARPGDSGKAP